jgi:putative transposase
MTFELLQPKTIYHVYTHVNGFENLFINESNYLYFLSKYSHYIYPIAETFAYCLMPNHLHLMIEIRSEKEVIEFIRLKQPNLQGFENLEGFSKVISQQFSNLFNSYTKAFNKYSNRKGSLFIPRFKRKEVTNESYLSQLIVYIHNNPVHHGFVKHIIDWPYSSIHVYISDQPSKLNREYMNQWFGDKEELLKFHKQDSLPAKLRLDEFV